MSLNWLADGMFLYFQHREKISKDARRVLLTPEHKQLISIVAFKIDVDPGYVEEAVLDTEKVITVTVREI